MKRMFALLTVIASWGSIPAYADDQALDFPPNANVDLAFVVNTLAAGNDSAIAGGFLKIRNVTRIPVRVLHPRSRGALTYLVIDSAGNPVAPKPRSKSDPPQEAVSLPPGGALTYDLGRLSFVSETGEFDYALSKGQRYSIVTVYRPLGTQGPAFVSNEVRQSAD